MNKEIFILNFLIKIHADKNQKFEDNEMKELEKIFQEYKKNLKSRQNIEKEEYENRLKIIGEKVKQFLKD